MTKFFKALIPFSSYEGIFNPGDTTPGKAPKEKVDAWIEAGYVKEVEAPEHVEQVEPQEEKNHFEQNLGQTVDEMEQEFMEKQGNAQKYISEPVQPQESFEGVNVQNDDLNAKNEQISVNPVAYESMSYPQLKKAAKDAGIAKYNSMKQIDLVNALKGE